MTEFKTTRVNHHNDLAITAGGKALAGIAVAVVTFICFMPALGNEFVNWDDHVYVLDNDKLAIRDWRELLELIFTPLASNWHPLTNLSLALDHYFWGKNPFGYHLTNVLLHSLNGFCVFWLTFDLLSFVKPRMNHRRMLISAGIAALVFALHPLRVESVAWVSERKDVLYALFYLLALMAYLAYVRAQPSRKTLRYSLVCLFFLLSLLSKSMAVTLPVLLLLLDFYPLERMTHMERGLRLLKEKIPLFILAAIFAGVAIVTQTETGAVKTVADIRMWDRVLNAVFASSFYLYKFFLPVELAPFYPHPVLSKHVIPIFAYALSFGVFLVLTIVSIGHWRAGKPQLATVWASYLLILLPVIGLVHIGGHSAADRYTYVSMTGICILIAVFATGWLERKRWQRVTILLLLLVMLPLMILQTRQQVDIWRNSGQLWNRAIAAYPMTDALPYFSRGQWYMAQPQGDGPAIADFSTAIELQPAHWDALQNRGILYAEQGNNDAAFADFNRAIALNPGLASGYVNRGALHHRLGNLELATFDYQRALEIDPQQPIALHNLQLIRNQNENF